MTTLTMPRVAELTFTHVPTSADRFTGGSAMLGAAEARPITTAIPRTILCLVFMTSFLLFQDPVWVSLV
jgi:hypothetical protein